MRKYEQLKDIEGNDLDPKNLYYEMQLEDHKIRINNIETHKVVYSSVEFKTNRVYKDGNGIEHDIYHKTISASSPSTADAFVTIANIDIVPGEYFMPEATLEARYATNTIVFYKLNIDEGDGRHYALIAFHKNGGDIQMKVGSDLRNYPVKIDIDYIKNS